MSSRASPRPTTSEALALLAPLALAAGGYWRTLRGDFQLDDLPGIVENPAVKGLGRWLEGALHPAALVAGRPLTTLTFAANYAVGRIDPLGYHVVNLALHLVVVLLAGLLALRVATLAGAERPRRIALGVAGLFAVHPLQSQAVSYVSQRAEVLASALYVATLLLLLARPPGDGWRRGVFPAAALAAFALGLAAKPIVLSLPLAYRAIHAAAAPGSAPEGARGQGRRLPGIAPIAVAAVAFAAALLLALRGRPDAGFSVAGTSAWRYFLTELRAMVVYLRLLAWPASQSADWDFRTSPGLADPATLGAALAVGTLAAAAILLLVRGRRDPSPRGATARLAGLGVAWYFVVLSVTSSFVPLSDNLVEHRAYLASWGVLLAAVVALDALAARLAAPAAATVAWVLVVAVLAAALHRRNAVWESREALWTDVVAKAPGSARGRLGLAEALAAEGRTAAAIREYELALGLAGGNVAQRAKILLGLGAAQMAAGRGEDARRSLEAGLHFLPDDDELLATLALLAGATGDAAASESLARRALGRNPSHAVSWLVLGNLALERGDWPGALAAYDRAVATDPDRGEAHYGRALALGRLGRAGDACAALRTALVARLAPEYRASVESGVRERCR